MTKVKKQKGGMSMENNMLWCIGIEKPGIIQVVA